ncbi:uncharacterized protein LOC127115760 [Lathyrus oleraceus]|uniref:uncharacterized protein LOC127115760 n=1 Tax=Pisum sativum TaxID=3888 RepID=UPI0021D21C97|nr:uncharacterized protein LOC127115760 [Pisum sativum]
MAAKGFSRILVMFLFVSVLASLPPPPPPPDPFGSAPHQYMFPVANNPNRNLKKSPPKSVVAGVVLFVISVSVGVLVRVCLRSSSSPPAAGTVVGVTVPLQQLRSME